MYKQKNERGITLVTLAITIVVMCILAGVTVHQTISENGIFHSITKIGQEAKLELKNAVNSTEEEIKDNLDRQVGVENKDINNNVNLTCIDKWSTYLTVQLDISSYEFKEGQYGIKNIKYGIKKEGADYDLKNLKSGTESKYICKFENLTMGTSYKVGAFVEYINDEGTLTQLQVPIAETEGITTYKWTFKVGDYVDYEAGTWSQEEIDNLNSKGLYYSDYSKIKSNITQAPINYNGGGTTFNSNRNKFSGMTVGFSRDSGQTSTKTSYYGTYSTKLGSGTISSSSAQEESSISENSAAVTKGWRILNITSDGNIELVSAGIPEYFIGKCLHMSKRLYDMGGAWRKSNSFYLEKDVLNAISKRDFSEYVNSTYATKARLMDYNDATKAQSVSDLSNIGCTYMLGTVRNGNNYKTIEYALQQGLYGSSTTNTQLMMYNNKGLLKVPTSTTKNSTTGEDYCLYSAGVLGVRIVVTLNNEYIPNNTKSESTETRTGNSYSSRLYLVKKSEIQ